MTTQWKKDLRNRAWKQQMIGFNPKTDLVMEDGELKIKLKKYKK